MILLFLIFWNYSPFNILTNNSRNYFTIIIYQYEITITNIYLDVQNSWEFHIKYQLQVSMQET